MIEDLNVNVAIDFYDCPYNIYINTVYSRADCFLLVNIVIDNKHYRFTITCVYDGLL